MVTYTLQWLIALTTVAFALVAHRIARPAATPDLFYRSAWKLVGVTYTVDAASQLVQYSWGGMALRGGMDSAWMASYLRWAPALNHSRTFLALCLAVALVVLALRAAPPTRGFWWVYLTAIAAALALSVAAGADEGPLVESTHFIRVALWDTAELVVVLGALFVLLVTDRVDRYLWAALATNGFSVALSVIWMAALSRMRDPSVWSPSPWQVAAYRLVLALIMLALVARRLSLGRRGLAIRGLIGRTSHPAPAFPG